jgi:hypothetical protein
MIRKSWGRFLLQLFVLGKVPAIPYFCIAVRNNIRILALYREAGE